MISIAGTDYQTHELRCISPGFKNALAQWIHDAPDDKLFCSLHGRMEPVSLFVPETIAYKADRIEREQEICGRFEESTRERVERDMAAARGRR